ncbi:hypothetical protein [Nocardia sp. CA-145437]|uniref:hypothetical protein n=1 Tax=Nocardia sp. CA-145437 TaxID=3239980 RepID=UPI003D97F113
MTAVPVAAALLALHPDVAAADPGPPSIGEIISGSAGGGAPDAGDTAAPIDAPTGSALGLGTGSSYSGNQGRPGGRVVTGNPAGRNPMTALDLGSSSPDIPRETTAGAPDLVPPEPPATPIAIPNTLGGLLGLDSGSVLTACAGSAVVGSAALGLGILTGSGMGSGLIGPGFIPGSSGLVGPGSAGAGSVVVGSAATGSALLTCMLLLPVPMAPEPGIPLLIPPAAPAVVPAAAPVVAPLPEAVPPAPAPIPPPPPPVDFVAPDPPQPAVSLTALQVMTVMIITIIAGARARLARAHHAPAD